MKRLVLNNEIEVRVFLYDTEDERDEDIILMEGMGFTVERKGTAGMDDDSRKFYVEFAKVREKLKTKDNISYYTEFTLQCVTQ